MKSYGIVSWRFLSLLALLSFFFVLLTLQDNGEESKHVSQLHDMMKFGSENIAFQSTTTNHEQNLTASPSKKSKNNSNSDKSAISKIYIVNAYQLPNNYLRVIFMSQCGLDKATIEAYYNIEERTYITKSHSISLIGVTCPHEYFTACVINGFLAEFQLPSESALVKEVIIRHPSDKTKSLAVPVTQISSSKQRKHFLAVCTKPVYYFNDWIQLIQFMESWLINGATKYYIYWRSISVRVQRIIELYQSDGIDIEMIEWPSTRDAEAKLFMSGQFESLQDCILRAQSDAQFVGLVDFDELLFIPNQSVVSVLQRLGVHESGLSFSSQELTTNSYTITQGRPLSTPFRIDIQSSISCSFYRV